MALNSTLDSQLHEMQVNLDDDSSDTIELQQTVVTKHGNRTTQFQSLNESSSVWDIANLRKEQKVICLLIIIIILLMVALIAVIALLTTKHPDTNPNSNTAESLICTYNEDSFISSSNTSNILYNSSLRVNNIEITKAKNIILMIGDGMGTIYNTGYRLYKQQKRTILDDNFKGRYSTSSSNHTITDSAAGAFAFSAGMKTYNGFIGIDQYGNPKGTILEAAKRLNKGTGLVSLSSVTDATPASFASHTMNRGFQKLIAKQLSSFHMNYKWNNCTPIVDILMGGGRMYFDASGFNQSTYQQYGWNKLFYDNQTLYTVCADDIPFIGLFAQERFPFQLDIKNDDELNDIPALLDMSKMSIHLLNETYNDNGFFLMIEGSEIDLCGHSNDIGCALNEMESFIETVEYVLNWAENDGETLVVILADHQTGGFTIGREDSVMGSEIRHTKEGFIVPDDKIIEYYGNYMNNPLLASQDPRDNMTHMYIWHPEIVNNIKHTAFWINQKIRKKNITYIQDVYELVEENWFELSDQEKLLLKTTFKNGTGKGMGKALVYLLSVRTQTGWTTHGHTAIDVSLYAYGVSSESFIGHWSNDEIGQLLTRILDCKEQQNQQTELLEKLFLNGTLQLCDKTDHLPYVDWNYSVPYPYGNMLYPQECVDSWVN